MRNTNEPTGQQLTPVEEARKYAVVFSGVNPEIEHDECMKSMRYNLAYIHSLEGFKYGAQQTAARQEEALREYREQLTIAISLLQGFPIAEPGDFSIGGKHHEWYCKRCDFLEANGALGTGLIQQPNEKDTRIKELEEHAEMIKCAGGTVISSTQLSLLVNGIEARDALIGDMEKHLETVKKERDRWKYAYEDSNRNMEATHIAKCETDKQLEALKFKLKDAQSESEYYQSLYLNSGGYH